MVAAVGAVVFNKDWYGYFLNMRWQAVRALTPRRIVRSRGLRLTLQCDNRITHYRWKTYNAKEPEMLDWIDRWVHDGDTIFDIGANIGVYSLYMALRHPQAKVVAFEPEYANLHLLKDNVVENGLQSRVDVYGLALSNHSGVSYLHLQDLTPGAALHSESRERLAVTDSQLPVIWREGIYTTTLDRFCEETGRQPQGLKIDVDGAELAVLEGGSQMLCSEGLRSVIIEMDAKVRESCASRLSDAGLQRAWWEPGRRSSNEIWVRRSLTNGAPAG
ncbi:MAG: hypothetical protein A3D28_02830 [Omnitrophica bacterium RIFCSPHIGHO2_02_FULL_63_14]|nr:MAG: hypothetical protein A3D28_02830 [Omnitrophica bacterium RIFCSPHIGHO2_02_FULL_63_14]